MEKNDENHTHLTRKDLEDLVTNCPELEELENILSRFDLFDTLGIEKNERAHSAFLKWLLDPRESHGLGDYFLKRFLKNVIQRNWENPHIGVTVIDIDVMDLTGCLVQTEEPFPSRRRADISVLDEDNKLYVLIENKILSGEGHGQTPSYSTEARNRYPDHKRLMIFLTPQGIEAESEEFLRFDYQEVVELLKNILDARAHLMGEEQLVLIRQFIWNMEANVMEDSDVEELCLKIYEKHRKAIDKIIECRPTNRDTYETLAKNVVDRLNEDWTYHATNSYCAIFREGWKREFNPEKKVPFFHYEYLEVGEGNVRIDIHIERWSGGEEMYGNLKRHLGGLADVLRGVDLSRSQILYKKIVTRKLYEDPEKSIEAGIDEMVKLIKRSKDVLDAAAEKALHEA